jgi:hypothetical protein
MRVQNNFCIDIQEKSLQQYMNNINLMPELVLYDEIQKWGLQNNNYSTELEQVYCEIWDF